MRDVKIMEIQKAGAQMDLALWRQQAFIRLRVEAFEKVLQGSLARRLQFVFLPSWFWSSVDAVHRRLYQVEEEKLRAVSCASRIMRP